MSEIDPSSLVAIDVHTHVHSSVRGGTISPDSPEAAVGEVFGTDALLSVPELAAYYRERKMAAVCFMVDSVNWDGSVSNEEILAPQAMTRFGEPEEVAAAVVWLCSDEASFVTGVELPVDAGSVAWVSAHRD